MGAEWLAVRCLAGILPATTVDEWEANRCGRAVLFALVERHGLSASSLAGHVLFCEACPCNAEHSHIAQQALGLYLRFADVPRDRQERLAALWRDHAWGAAQLQAYRSNEASGRRRDDGLGAA